MEFFKIHRDIPFMRHALVFNIISLLTFLAAVFFLFSRGLHLSVEFNGGTLLEVSYAQPVDLNAVRNTVTKLGIGDVQVQNFGTARDVLIRMPAAKAESTGSQADQAAAVLKAADRQSEQVMAALKAADPSAEQRRKEFVGPQVGDELATDGLKALAFGSGPVRGFAVVHCLGILTSMSSGVFFSRGLVNLWYGRQKKLKSVSIGTVWRPAPATPAKAD